MKNRTMKSSYLQPLHSPQHYLDWYDVGAMLTFIHFSFKSQEMPSFVSRNSSFGLQVAASEKGIILHATGSWTAWRVTFELQAATTHWQI